MVSITLKDLYNDVCVHIDLSEIIFDTQLRFGSFNVCDVLRPFFLKKKIDVQDLFPTKLKCLRGLRVAYDPKGPGIQKLYQMFRKLPQSLDTLEIELVEYHVPDQRSYYLSMQGMFTNLTSLSVKCEQNSFQQCEGIIHFPPKLLRLRYRGANLNPEHLPKGLVFLKAQVDKIPLDHTFPRSLRSMKGDFPVSAISLLPDTLEHLKIGELSCGSHDIGIPTFPQSLHTLIILRELVKLPASALVHLRSLNTLIIRYTQTKSGTLQLPERLTNVCMMVDHMPVLPDSLRKVNIFLNKPNLDDPFVLRDSTFVQLPPVLESFTLKSNFEKLQFKTPLPSTLRKLHLEIPYHGMLPELPHGMQKIYLSYESYKTTLPRLPETLKSLFFGYAAFEIKYNVKEDRQKVIAHTLFTNIPLSLDYAKHQYIPLTAWNELRRNNTSGERTQKWFFFL